MLTDDATMSKAKMRSIWIHMIGFIKYFKSVNKIKDNANAMNPEPKITGQLFLKSLEYFVVSLIPI
jgi:hypothetical protein